ncbi:hypothetical protein VF21_09683 [Pseudogymnoascus sp. 05NY08]|nr:hypothetical protein VF21_09683 [Pseudogymnoascus sp. 05NY08]
MTTFNHVTKALSTLKALRSKETRAEDTRLEELDEYLRKIKAAADMFNTGKKILNSKKIFENSEMGSDEEVKNDQLLPSGRPHRRREGDVEHLYERDDEQHQLYGAALPRRGRELRSNGGCTTSGHDWDLGVIKNFATYISPRMADRPPPNPVIMCLSKLTAFLPSISPRGLTRTRRRKMSRMKTTQTKNLRMKPLTDEDEVVENTAMVDRPPPNPVIMCLSKLTAFLPSVSPRGLTRTRRRKTSRRKKPLTRLTKMRW